MKSVKYLFLETGNSLSPGRGGGWVQKVLGDHMGFQWEQTSLKKSIKVALYRTANEGDHKNTPEP